MKVSGSYLVAIIVGQTVGEMRSLPFLDRVRTWPQFPIMVYISRCGETPHLFGMLAVGTLVNSEKRKLSSEPPSLPSGGSCVGGFPVE